MAVTPRRRHVARARERRAIYTRMPTRLSVEPLGGGACSFVVRSSPGHPLLPVVASVGALAAAVAAGSLAVAPAAAVLIVLLCLWLLSRRFIVREESLTAIEGVGLQLCTRCASGRETAQFIEVAAISAIFLTEAVRFDRCYFYLACLLHGDEAAGGDNACAPQMVVPFHHLLPPLHDLQRIYHGVWSVLWRGTEPTSPGTALSPLSAARGVSLSSPAGQPSAVGAR